MAKIFSTFPIIGIDLTKVYRRTDTEPIHSPCTVAYGSDGYKYVFAMLVEPLTDDQDYVGIVEGKDHPGFIACEYHEPNKELYNDRDGGHPHASVQAIVTWQFKTRNPGEEEAALIQRATERHADFYDFDNLELRNQLGTQIVPRFKRVVPGTLEAETYAWFRALRI